MIDMLKHTATLSITILLLMVSLCAVVVAGQKRYFPEGALDPASTGSDGFRNSWYSGQLEVMSEPALKPVAGTRTYRFTWLRTFNHPVAIRVVIGQAQCTLHATELDGAGGSAPGRVYRQKVEEIAPEACARFEAFIRDHGFWSIARRGSAVGEDGSEWIIEGVTDRYRVVTRWTPESGPVRAIGEQFLSLAGWKYPQREMH
ncbi:hypothetical protein ATSB10_10550 [Dyella thiooxydans]|uniref:Uncharacterized protein n=1 Tax=Dyella thiooxydans TaxID=445710 RepID=A0A161J784_9GAMM|nr:hypothetical protein [Dyella thiooxydans]AND68509.1 hypothetical protein ATSB10_10550 [Dyella thiooxydans]